MEKTKILIVGAGPAGIATAVEAKVAGLNGIVILEKTDHICDTIVRLYHPGKRVDPNFQDLDLRPTGTLSFETTTKEEFLQFMQEIVEKYALNIRYKHPVDRIVKKNGFFEVRTGKDCLLKTPIVVLAIGIFGRPVKPNYKIPKEVKDKVFFGMPISVPENKKVLVVGGGNTAAETACLLSEKNKVFLSYRRPQFFRLNLVNLDKLKERQKQSCITLLLNTDIESIEPDESQVKVSFKDGRKMSFDAIYYCLGGATPQSFLRSIGVELEGKRPKVESDGETNIRGLFLVGDLVAEKGNIIFAFNSAKRAIDGILRKYSRILKGGKNYDE